jgi:hypothetical protein
MTALTATAATTLVQRLTTDGWERVKSAVGTLWRRVHPERSDAVEAELAETRLGVLEARQTGDERAEQDLISEWRSRLQRLVRADPKVADELRRLVEQWESPPSSAGETQIGRVDMHARASGHSRVTMAGRDVHITGP